MNVKRLSPFALSKLVMAAVISSTATLPALSFATTQASDSSYSTSTIPSGVKEHLEHEAKILEQLRPRTLVGNDAAINKLPNLAFLELSEYEK